VAWQYADYFPMERREKAYERLTESLKLRANVVGIDVIVDRLMMAGVADRVDNPASKPYSKTPNGNSTYIFGRMEFVKVSAGSFFMGSDEMESAAPFHEVNIPYDYWISRFPITNAQYFIFTRDARKSFAFPRNKGRHPVKGVSWYDAQDYIGWLNATQLKDLPQDFVFSLPSEVEWEKAARGNDRRIYPWGNEFSKFNCNMKESEQKETTPIDMYSPQGDSPYGVADMVGNVWEWTRSLRKNYPYYSNDGRELGTPKNSDWVSIRGGAYIYGHKGARVAVRGGSHPQLNSDSIGLRVSAIFLNSDPIGFRISVIPLSQKK
jgi:formylglycine-generating enzyme required for sulfatase activity